MYIRRITFDDKTQTIWRVFRTVQGDKAVARRVEEHIADKKEYFIRKLKGE